MGYKTLWGFFNRKFMGGCSLQRESAMFWPLGDITKLYKDYIANICNLVGSLDSTLFQPYSLPKEKNVYVKIHEMKLLCV